MSRVSKYIGFHLALNDISSEHLLQSRMVIEIGALPYAMRRILADPSVAIALDEAAELGEAAASETPEDEEAAQPFVDADVLFHRRLIEASGLDPLVAFNDLLRVFFTRFRRSVYDAREGWRSGLAEHRRIVEALREGNLQLAQSVLTQHLEYHRGHL